MVQIKLRIGGSPEVADLLEGDIVNTDRLSEIVRHQKLLDNYAYDYLIFINGVSVDDDSKSLHDGDEVLLVPIAVGG